MRLIFAGTPEFAARALDALVLAGHEIALVLTQPDRPAGRGLKLKPSAVKTRALAHGLEILQPASLKTPEIQATLASHAVDAMIVAAYGLIIPAALLAMPRLGCINIHASLLPRWRGAAPIQRAILAGDNETGITLMQMDAGLDTGAILSRHGMPIECSDTAGSLTVKLADLGAEAIVERLPDIARGALAPEPQDERLASYAAKISKHEAIIDWRQDAEDIARAIRAFDPMPGARSRLGGVDVKIWRAHPVDASGMAGEIIAASGDALVVACGAQALAITELQAAGGRRMSVAAYLAGGPIALGECFESPLT